MKEKIELLLAGESFKEYLEGVELFNENVGTQALPDEVLDQNIIERVCAVMIPERWVSHKDYANDIERFMNMLPNYLSHMEDDDIGHDLSGLVLFINGLNQHELNTSGFLLSNDGYVSCGTASETIGEYFEGKNNLEAVAFFASMKSFFDAIVDAQFGAISAFQKIKNWNVSMTDGFYNILTASDVSKQSWMLGSLYEVVNHDVVKTEIFDKYINTLNEVKKRYIEESKVEHIDSINEILEMVISRSKGE